MKIELRQVFAVPGLYVNNRRKSDLNTHLVSNIFFLHKVEWFSGFYLINYRNSDYLPMGPFDAGSGYVAVVRITVLDTQKYADLFKVIQQDL